MALQLPLMHRTSDHKYRSSNTATVEAQLSKRASDIMRITHRYQSITQIYRSASVRFLMHLTHGH